MNFAVSKQCRRLGVGTAMVDKLRSKLSDDRRTLLSMDITEDNLDAHLFFSKQGFVASKIMPGFFDNRRSAYQFNYRVQWNRITEKQREYSF